MVSRYHRFLRIALVIVTLVLLFDGGFVFPVTKLISQNTRLYLAEVGVGVAARVEENEINTISAKLSARERALDAREASIQEREIAARSFGDTETDYSVYVLSAILSLLTILIGINYVMDWQRFRRVFTYEREIA
jgi:hypothetical protein